MVHVAQLYDYYDKKYHIDKKVRYATADVPILGDINKAIDSWNYTNDYLNNRGISWDNVKYPTLMKGASNGFYSAFQPSEKALQRLYSDEQNKYMRNLRAHHYKTAIDANNMRRAWYYSRM